jgi:hypothetical protein
MQSGYRILYVSVLFFAFLLGNAFEKPAVKQANLSGAWVLQDNAGEQVLLLIDGYLTHTTYNKSTRQFVNSRGGTYQATKGQLTTKLEFDAKDKEQVGLTLQYQVTENNDVLTTDITGRQEKWKRLDNGTAPLTGVWRITQRMQEGKLTPIHQTGSRKTLKILSGSRFQWAAINPETKEFSGTGGGTYTFENNKYTEQIEFFSRDSSRVGASLSFDGKLQNGDWHHSGLSSRGDAIYEVWSKVK